MKKILALAFAMVLAVSAPAAVWAAPGGGHGGGGHGGFGGHAGVGQGFASHGGYAHQAPVFHGHGFDGHPHRFTGPHADPFFGIYPYPAPYYGPFYGSGYLSPDPACWWNVDHWVGCR